MSFIEELGVDMAGTTTQTASQRERTSDSQSSCFPIETPNLAVHQDYAVEKLSITEGKAFSSSPKKPSAANKYQQKASNSAKVGDIHLLRQAYEEKAQLQDVAIQNLDNGSPEVCACLLDAGLDPNYRFLDYIDSVLICAARRANVPL